MNSNRYIDDRLEESIFDTAHVVDDISQGFAEQVGPAIEEYKARSRKTHDEYRELVEEYTIGELNCDPVCVSDCTNQRIYNLLQVPECISQCQCDFPATITPGTPNYPELVQYSDGNVTAWSFFLTHRI
jgi:hypothetical protein